MYRSILVATDGSDISRRAAEHAIALAKVCGSGVFAAFVVDTRLPPFQHPALPESSASRYDSMLKEVRASGEALLRELAEEARKVGVVVQPRVIDGIPSMGILNLAEETAADLIVMGTHGRTGLGALLMGSTAQAVVHRAMVPVLLVR